MEFVSQLQHAPRVNTIQEQTCVSHAHLVAQRASTGQVTAPHANPLSTTTLIMVLARA